MNPERAALEEYANPRNWTYVSEHDEWVFVDDEKPWARAADALAKGEEAP